MQKCKSYAESFYPGWITKNEATGTNDKTVSSAEAALLWYWA